MDGATRSNPAGELSPWRRGLGAWQDVVSAGLLLTGLFGLRWLPGEFVNSVNGLPTLEALSLIMAPAMLWISRYRGSSAVEDRPSVRFATSLFRIVNITGVLCMGAIIVVYVADRPGRHWMIAELFVYLALKMITFHYEAEPGDRLGFQRQSGRRLMAGFLLLMFLFMPALGFPATFLDVEVLRAVSVPILGFVYFAGLAFFQIGWGLERGLSASVETLFGNAAEFSEEEPQAQTGPPEGAPASTMSWKRLLAIAALLVFLPGLAVLAGGGTSMSGEEIRAFRQLNQVLDDQLNFMGAGCVGVLFLFLGLYLLTHAILEGLVEVETALRGDVPNAEGGGMRDAIDRRRD